MRTDIRFKRIVAILLIIALMAPGGGSAYLAAETYEDRLDGWKVECVWSDLAYDYVWNATEEQDKFPKMIFSYHMENAAHYFAPGSLKVDIPGIGNACRGNVVKASAIAAEMDGSEWEVSWDEISDVYSFTNKFEVETGQSVNGGFEILWKMNSRDLTDGYTQRRSPKFSVNGAGSIALRPVGFSFTSLRDTYRIYLDGGRTSADEYEDIYPDYDWYNITLTVKKDWHSRGLYMSDCMAAFTLPEGLDGDDVVVISDGGFKITPDEEDGEFVFDLFKGLKGNLAEKGYDYFKNFRLGISSGIASGEEVRVRAHLDRLYCDEEEWVNEAGEGEITDAEYVFTLDDYGFSYQGLIYSHDLWNVSYEYYKKPPDYYWYGHGDEFTHNEPRRYEERLCAADLFKGKVVEFVLLGEARKDYRSQEPAMLFSSPSDALRASPSYMQKEDEPSVYMVGEKEEYSMVLGDDQLAVYLRDGSMRSLEDDEYDFTYVRVPKYEKNFEYEIYGAASKDTPFDEYELLESADMSSQRTFPLPEGIKAFFVRINGVRGNFVTDITAGVRIKLDWKEEQEKDPEERCDHENRVVDFSFMRILTKDPQGEEHNDCRLTAEDYNGSYGEVLADHDVELYGEWLLRDYSNIWLRPTSTTLKATAYIDDPEPDGKEKYTSQITAGGSIRSDNEGEIFRFSLYIVLPDGFRPDLYSGAFTAAGTLTANDGERIAYPEDYVSFSEGIYQDKKMVIADFDFRDNPLKADALNRIQVSLPVDLSYADYALYGQSYSLSVYLLVHDEGLDNIIGQALVTDEYDIDQNGITTEKMAYAGAKAVIAKDADEWREYVSKYVKSAYSDGYVPEAVTKRWDLGQSGDDAESVYQYRLDFGLGSSGASDIVFYDRLEAGASLISNDAGHTVEVAESEWQGEFLSVDLAYVKSQGLKPTVYYSSDPDEAFDLSSPGWSSTMPDDKSSVRSIAVALDTSGLSGGVLTMGNLIYVLVNMCAPESEDFLDKRAVNQYTVSYDSYGLSGEFEGKHVLHSAAAKVKLLDTVGNIILEKVDSDNILRMDAEGNPHYATLTGADFQIYDDKGKTLFESPLSLNSLGRLVVNDIPYGTYYWEEISAPPGYELIEGRHAFGVNGTGAVITVGNHRIGADVTLKKHDQDDARAPLLAGAEFELSRSDGEKIFTDASYNYLPEGGICTFVTGEDGTFTITGLPWGSYVFTEVSAPEGYELSPASISFMAGRNMYDPDTKSISVTVDAWDYEKTASICLVKNDALSSEPVPGAVYSLYLSGEDGEKDECIASGLKTGPAGEIEVNGLKFGTYYFVETANPYGYILPEKDLARTDDVVLDASTAGDTLEIFHTDERMKGSVALKKLDDAGRPVGGAAFDLYALSDDGDQKLCGSYITGTDKDDDNYGEIFADDLEWGEYCFIETRSPQGYELSTEPVRFSVNRETAQNTIELDVVNERMRGTVKLIKTDRYDHARVLSGAEFALYFNSGKPCLAGIDYQLPEGEEKIVTKEDGSVIVTGLSQGAYFFKEITPPDSYSLNTEIIRFSITMENASTVQELLVEDDRGRAVLTIDKEVNEVYDVFGEATFIFKITRSDGAVYFTSITLAPDILAGSVSLNVDQGYTYTVEEIGISRYLPERVEAISNAEVYSDLNLAVADLIKNEAAKVKFYDRIDQYEKFSHSVNVINSVKRSAMLTAVSVEYRGSDPITSDLPGYDAEEELYVIPAEDLFVTAYYDDGTSEAIYEGDYKLSPPFADGNSESYTGTVSLTRKGVTRSASFSVGISLPLPEPKSWLIFELNGGMMIPPGEESAVNAYALRVKTGSQADRPANDPVRENYTFRGWFMDEDLKDPALFPLTVDGDTHIYAGWDPRPVQVRYAVSLYGIGADTDGEGKTTGLTFGPALGASWLNNSRSHSASEGQKCLHSMTWDEIAEAGKSNPETFRECLQNGCTHAVDLTIKGDLAENVSPIAYSAGDGASVLRYSVNEAYLSWAAKGDETAGYPSSLIRETLNDLADALPEDLRSYLVKKKIENDTVDEIWLFSLGELIPGASEDLKDGKLYERQKVWGMDAKDLTGYAENGRGESFWLRSSLKDGSAFIVSDCGSPEEDDIRKPHAIAFGFCLPGPEPSTRLAVSLYGIRHDTYMEKNGVQGVAGLTFGPAVGGDYRNSFVSHDPTGVTDAGNRHRCIHDDDWEDIAAWSQKDPCVYEQCMGNKETESCTKGIDMFLNDSVADKSFSFKGDGAGVMFESLQLHARNWCYPYSIDVNAVTDGGWPASRIRAVLNGADSYTNKLIDGSDALTAMTHQPTAGEDPPGEELSIFSCLPAVLQENIVPKAVISDTWYDDSATTDYTMTTYDRLWLFSAREIWALGARAGTRPNEGEIYEKQALREINGDGGEPNTVAYSETKAEKMFLRSISEKALSSRFKHYGIGKTGDRDIGDVFKSNMGVGFGFCLK